MALSVLDFPPEIIVNILSFLPVQALLRFSLTSRTSHTLAISSLRTLSLGVYTNRIARQISQISATQYPMPKHTFSAFASSSSSDLSSPLETSQLDLINQKSSAISSESQLAVSLFDPTKVSVIIPNAQTHHPATLLAFHNALTKSILARHGATLHTLTLSLWTLTLPVAAALAALPALRNLAIRIEDFPQMRGLPWRLASLQGAEERRAWALLCEKAAWAPRLHALRLEGAEIRVQDLMALLGRAQWCRELWVCRCAALGRELWAQLAAWNASGQQYQCAVADPDRGGGKLSVLGVMQCGGAIAKGVLEQIGRLRGLQFLSLQGCYGSQSDLVELRNDTEWKIPEIVLPPRKEMGGGNDSAIEVDPLFLLQDDDED